MIVLCNKLFRICLKDCKMKVSCLSFRRLNREAKRREGWTIQHRKIDLSWHIWWYFDTAYVFEWSSKLSQFIILDRGIFICSFLLARWQIAHILYFGWVFRNSKNKTNSLSSSECLKKLLWCRETSFVIEKLSNSKYSGQIARHTLRWKSLL